MSVSGLIPFIYEQLFKLFLTEPIIARLEGYIITLAQSWPLAMVN